MAWAYDYYRSGFGNPEAFTAVALGDTYFVPAESDDKNGNPIPRIVTVNNVPSERLGIVLQYRGFIELDDNLQPLVFAD